VSLQAVKKLNPISIPPLANEEVLKKDLLLNFVDIVVDMFFDF